MPSKAVERALLSIRHTIALARRFIGDTTVEAFAEDERTIYAVTRCLAFPLQSR